MVMIILVLIYFRRIVFYRYIGKYFYLNVKYGRVYIFFLFFDTL